uniref:Phylloplanin n=1 Tax=Kalanchoe fedtschenkoi TaxID=63787 RepID=A0A7N0T765_KALFE
MAFTVKPSTLISLLVVAIALLASAAPSAHAQQFPGLGGGGGGILRNIFNLFRIRGTIFCSLNGTMASDINGTATPPFGNALVQLRCGTNVITASATDPSGLFSILMNPLQVIMSTLLNNCNLMVVTPLTSCNAQLPSIGRLFSPLQFNGSSLLGFLNIANLIPGGFSFQLPQPRE